MGREKFKMILWLIFLLMSFSNRPLFNVLLLSVCLPVLSFCVKDGLVKANMEKLTFYALSAPEKLDRIGAYLSERLSRDVARHRYGYKRKLEGNELIVSVWLCDLYLL